MRIASRGMQPLVPQFRRLVLLSWCYGTHCLNAHVSDTGRRDMVGLNSLAQQLDTRTVNAPTRFEVQL